MQIDGEVAQPVRRKRRRRCERCGELGALPVVFGTAIGLDPAEAAPPIYAGCEVMRDAPRYASRPCARAIGLIV